MSEQETMDELLRRSMSAVPPPSLSRGFEQRLARQIRPRRLGAPARRLLALYALITLVASVWVMRNQAIDWSLIVAAVVVPLTILAVVQRRYLMREKFGAAATDPVRRHPSLPPYS